MTADRTEVERCQTNRLIQFELAVIIALMRSKSKQLSLLEHAKLVKLSCRRKVGETSQLIRTTAMRSRSLRRQQFYASYGTDEVSNGSDLSKPSLNLHQLGNYQDELTMSSTELVDTSDIRVMSNVLQIQMLANFKSTDCQSTMYLKDALIATIEYVGMSLSSMLASCDENIQIRNHNEQAIKYFDIAFATQAISNVLQFPQMYFVRPHVKDLLTNLTCQCINQFLCTSNDDFHDMVDAVLFILCSGDELVHILVIQCLVDCGEQMCELVSKWITAAQTFDQMVTKRSTKLLQLLDRLVYLNIVQRRRSPDKQLIERIAHCSQTILSFVSYFDSGATDVCIRLRATASGFPYNQ